MRRRAAGLRHRGASAIYYHVTQSNDRYYIDYWIFYRFNHFSRSAPGLSCKSQLARENDVCDEHEGDWEGVTEVTQPDDATRLDYIVYAAHKGTFRYSAVPAALMDGTPPGRLRGQRQPRLLPAPVREQRAPNRPGWPSWGSSTSPRGPSTAGRRGRATATPARPTSPAAASSR